jgi:FlaA1/EpsC-like NDP-sugar epimerase
MQGLVLLGIDLAIIALSAMLAYWVRFEGSVPPQFRSTILPVVIVAATGYAIAFWVSSLYKQVWRYVGVDMILRLLVAVSVVTGLLVFIDLTFVRGEPTPGTRYAPLGSIAALGAFVFIGAAALRAFGRFVAYAQALGPVAGKRRIVIAGAGDAGSLLLRDIENQPELGMRAIGFVDDDRNTWGRFIRGTRVLGPITHLRQLVESGMIDEVFVAMPGADKDQRRQIVDLCASLGVPTRIMQTLAARPDKVGLADMRQVHVEDLLGREPVPVDVHAIRETVTGQVVAVTGAAGSIGSELCRQLIGLEPKSLLLIDVDESRLYELLLEMQRTNPAIPEVIICDIRDPQKLTSRLRQHRPSLLLHAAAYKHVPLMEMEPDEAIKTNIHGTRNLIRACEDAGVGRFVLISTDKAVRPSSVMGTTKAVAELLTLQAAARGQMKATVVRFGNVLGSRGSVVPLFEEQLARGGPLRVTHAEATRYFMTIPEAARLVLQAQAISGGGEVYVLEMGEPVKILDLARKMIALSGIDSEIEITGLRPAEKLHEQLVHSNQNLLPTGCPKIQRLDSLSVQRPDFDTVIDNLVEAARPGDAAQAVVALQGVKGWFTC